MIRSSYRHDNMLDNAEMKLKRKVDRLSQEKLYLQLANILIDKIHSKEWPIGMRIPSGDELCNMFKVSKATVRVAVDNLVTDGYLSKVQGKGTYVSTTIPESGYTMKFRLASDMFGKTSDERRVLLAKDIVEPEQYVKILLKSGKDERVFYLQQVRLDHETPIVFEESYLSADIVSDVNELYTMGDEDLSVYDLIQKNSLYRVHKAMQTVEVTKIGDKEAAILKVPENSIGLLVKRLLLSFENKPLAYTELLGHGEKYKFHMEFESIR